VNTPHTWTENTSSPSCVSKSGPEEDSEQNSSEEKQVCCVKDCANRATIRNYKSLKVSKPPIKQSFRGRKICCHHYYEELLERKRKKQREVERQQHERERKRRDVRREMESWPSFSTLHNAPIMKMHYGGWHESSDGSFHGTAMQGSTHSRDFHHSQQPAATRTEASPLKNRTAVSRLELTFQMPSSGARRRSMSSYSARVGEHRENGMHTSPLQYVQPHAFSPESRFPSSSGVYKAETPDRTAEQYTGSTRLDEMHQYDTTLRLPPVSLMEESPVIRGHANPQNEHNSSTSSGLPSVSELKQRSIFSSDKRRYTR